MAGSDKDRGRSRRPGAEEQRWSSIGRVLGDRTVERSGDVVCGLYHAQGDEEREFPGLGLKTGSYSLVIWASKSPRWFLSLGLKTKWATVCRSRHKINEKMKVVRGTRQDLAACFTWKQIGLGFPSLASKLVEVQHG
jgi:hypothetical protein